MRRMALVVGIGAGLLAMVALHNTDSMAVELVHKKNFNLPKLAEEGPGPEDRALDPALPDVESQPILPEPAHGRRLVLKKNFNLPKLVLPPAPGGPLGGDLIFLEEGVGPEEISRLTGFKDFYDEDHYRPPIMFPLPNGGNDHADSPDHTDRTAGNDRRRSTRP